MPNGAAADEPSSDDDDTALDCIARRHALRTTPASSGMSGRRVCAPRVPARPVMIGRDDNEVLMQHDDGSRYEREQKREERNDCHDDGNGHAIVNGATRRSRLYKLADLELEHGARDAGMTWKNDMQMVGQEDTRDERMDETLEALTYYPAVDSTFDPDASLGGSGRGLVDV